VQRCCRPRRHARSGRCRPDRDRLQHGDISVRIDGDGVELVALTLAEEAPHLVVRRVEVRGDRAHARLIAHDGKAEIVPIDPIEWPVDEPIGSGAVELDFPPVRDPRPSAPSLMSRSVALRRDPFVWNSTTWPAAVREVLIQICIVTMTAGCSRSHIILLHGDHVMHSVVTLLRTIASPTATVREATANLSRLLDLAHHGQSTIITKRGRAIARIVSVLPPSTHSVSLEDVLELLDMAGLSDPPPSVRGSQRGSRW